MFRPAGVRIGNPSTLTAPSWMATTLGSPSTATFTSAWSVDQTWAFAYDTARAEIQTFTDPRGVVTTLAWASNQLYNLGLDVNNLCRSVASAISADSANAIALTRTWTWALPVRGNETAWTTTATSSWSGTGVVAAAVPKTSFAFAPPTDPNYGNAVPLSTTILDTSGNVLASEINTYSLVGVDSTLSALSTQTITTKDAPTTYLMSTLDAATGLPVTVARSTAKCLEQTSYTYESHPSILDPKRLLTVSTTRTTDSLASTAPVQSVEYDSATWFPNKRYLNASSTSDGKMGKTITYDSASGRPTRSSNFATTPLSATAGVSTGTFTLDATTGLPTQLTEAFSTPSGSDSYSQHWTSYDSADRPLVTVDGNNVTTTTNWDDRGRPLIVAKGGQATVTYAYPNERTQTTTVNLLTTVATTDGFGRLLTRKRGSDGVTESYTYDSNGNQVGIMETTSSNKIRTLTKGFDALGRMISLVPAKGPSVTYAYSVSQGKQAITVTCTPSGKPAFTAVTTKDLWGQTVSSTDPLGTVTTVILDAMGHPLTVTTTPSGGSVQTRTFTYNGLGLLTSKTAPETGTTTFSNFNARGQAQTLTEANGRVRSMTMDGLGRTRIITGGSDNQTYTYAGLRLSSASTVSGLYSSTVTYDYDDFSRLRKEAAQLTGLDITSWALTYTYDASGRLSRVDYPTGNTITYTIDDAKFGRITEVKKGTSLIATVNYDDWGNRADLIFGSGAHNTWSYGSDGLQPSSQILGQCGLADITRQYAFDTSNHLTMAGEWTSIESDVLGRLTRATVSSTSGIPLSSTDGPLSYTHDGYSNNSTAAGASTALFNNFSLAYPSATNRVPAQATNSAVTGWSYAANGEAQTIGKAIGAGAGQLALVWDGLGRLTSAGSESFGYLPSGLRSGLRDTSDPTQGRILAYSSAGALMTEYRQTSASPATFTPRDVVYLGGLAIAEIDGNGVVHELHSDHLGSPIMITSRATGVAEGWQFFGPFGEKVMGSGYQPTTGFTGHAQTDATGLIYMRGRFYSPAWHRFVNSDQGVDPSQLNQYAYCGGNPLGVIDPTGMQGTDKINYKWDPAGLAIENRWWQGGKTTLTFYSGNFAVDGLTTSEVLTRIMWQRVVFNDPNGIYFFSNGQRYFALWCKGGEWQDSTSFENTIDQTGPNRDGEGWQIYRSPEAQTSLGWSPSVGAFGFGGVEGDGAVAGGFQGVIHEYDTKHGSHTGALTEGWLGGEVGAVGLGKVTMPGEVLSGWFGFIGGSLSAGPAGGGQVGIIVGDGWIGFYGEGHLGLGAAGGGAYFNWAGK